jgi:Leu/Phe-tRNA-protein transferase
MKTIVYAVAALAALCASAWADGPKTWIGNDMFRYCKMAALLASEGRGIASAQDAGNAGGCQGFFVGLWFIAGELSSNARFCPPPKRPHCKDCKSW